MSAGAAESTTSVTVLFVDVVASTATMTRIGDDSADELRRAVFAIYQDGAAAHGGHLVKTMGDGAMLVFASSAVQAVAAGVAMIAAAADLEPTTALRVGMASGDAAEEDGDWFGTPVVLASRLCDAAAPGEVLVAESTRALVGSRGPHGFVARRPLRLKGFPERVNASAVVPHGPSSARTSARRSSRTLMVTLGVAISLALVAAAVVLFRSDDGEPRSESPASAAVEADWEPPDYEPQLTSRDCTEEESGGDTAVRCSTLTVPEDRAAPAGRQVELRVTTTTASGPETTGVPLVHFATASDNPTRLTTRSVADIVLLGVRGSHVSEPALTCPEVDESRPARLMQPALASAAVLDESLEACRTRLQEEGIALDRYGHLDITDDLRDLAAALAVEQIDVVARGEFAVSALAATQRHPGLVRSLTLLDPLPPGITDANQRPQIMAARFAEYAARCEASPSCVSGAPLEDRLDELREDFTTNPRAATSTDATGTPAPVLIDGDRLMQAVAVALDDSEALPLVASAIRSGDPAAAAGVLLLFLPVPGVEPDVAAMVRQCSRSSDLTDAQLASEATLGTEWRSLVDTGLPDRCRRWGIEVAPSFLATVGTDVPTLVLRGALSQASADEWVAGLASLPTLQQVELPNQSSFGTAPIPPCVVDLRRAFLLDPSAATDAEACAAADPPIAFVE